MPRDDRPALSELRDGVVAIHLSARAYTIGAVQRAAYRCARDCSAIVGDADDEHLAVTLTFAPTTTGAAARGVAEHFVRDLNDEVLRERIRTETETTRGLILAAAFSRAKPAVGG